MKIEKQQTLENGNQLFAFFANNKGRGEDNCTLMVVAPGHPRADYTRNQTGVISETRTSSWRGKVNFSKKVQRRLGLLN